jgi:hypothetical protein
MWGEAAVQLPLAASASTIIVTTVVVDGPWTEILAIEAFAMLSDSGAGDNFISCSACRKLN